jgi:hypothetical protein
MGANLLLGVGLVEIFRTRLVQIIDHPLMLRVELSRQLGLDALLLHDLFQLFSRLRMGIDHVLAELLHSSSYTGRCQKGLRPPQSFKTRQRSTVIYFRPEKLKETLDWLAATKGETPPTTRGGEISFKWEKGLVDDRLWGPRKKPVVVNGESLRSSTFTAFRVAALVSVHFALNVA